MSENSLDRPVLIVGAPRSGKSLITNVFRSAGDFCLVNEPLSIWNLGLAARPDDRRTAEEASPEIRQQIIAACLDQLRGAEQARYCDNLAYHALRIGFVHAVLPNAKLIFVTRSGYTAIPEMVSGWTMKASVIASARNARHSINWRTFPRLARTVPRLAIRFGVNYLTSRFKGRRTTWGPVVPGLREFATRHSIAETAAFQWRELNLFALEGLQELPADCWLQVRFEDLIDEPEQSFATIGRFAEVSSPDAVARHAVRFVDPNNIPEYSQWSPAEVGSDEWERIHPMIAPLQRQLGYETTTEPGQP